MQRSPNRNGVTLIEAVTVVLLLSAAAVATSATFHVKWSAKRRVTDVAQHVAQTFTMARNTAILNRAGTKVELKQSTSIPVIVLTEAENAFSAESVVEIPLLELNWESTGTQAAKISGSPMGLMFSPLGDADRDLRWNIAIDGVSAEIQVNARTGNVTTLLP